MSKHPFEIEKHSVCKRIEATKKEIRVLEEDLQKLISSNIEFKNENASTKSVSNNKTPVINDNTESKKGNLISHISEKSISKRKNEVQTKGDTSPKKIRSYNREAAQEYMKKQKEKRLQQTKCQEKDRIQEEIKREKLKELDRKTMQLLAENIKKKRQRSQSRENDGKKLATIESKKKNYNTVTIKKLDKNVVVKENSENKFDGKNLPITNNFAYLKNVTVRKPRSFPSDLEVKSKAAIKIQSYFRGYIARKKFKNKLAQNDKPESNHEDYVVSNIPWFKTPSHLSYPYNFINSVKKKLNFAVQYNKSCNDIGVQMSSKENIVSEISKTNKEAVEDIKNSLKESMKNLTKIETNVLFKKPSEDNKLCNLNIKEDPVTESDTSKNIPELSSENEPLTTDLESNGIYDHLKIKTEHLKKLKLRENLAPSSHDFESIESKLRNKNEQIILKNVQLSKSKSSNASKDTPIVSKSLSNLMGEKSEHIILHCDNDIRRQSIISGNHDNNSKDFQRYYKSNRKSKDYLEPTFEPKSETVPFFKTNIVILEDISEHLSPHTETKTENVESSSKKPTEVNSRVSIIDPKVSKPEFNENNVSVLSTTTYTSIPSLKKPSVSLCQSSSLKPLSVPNPEAHIIKLKDGEKKVVESQITTNQINVKFEAELHLLDDFNQSLRQFMAVEKSLLNLQSQQIEEKSVELQHKDTQTSICISPKSENSKTNKNVVSNLFDSKLFSSINYSRGCEIDVEEIGNLSDIEPLSVSDMTEAELELTKIDNSYMSADKKKLCDQMYFGIPLQMFEQLIQEENARIENLKAVLSIREKALLDRTKCELTWLEIQKKHLRATGQLQEISYLKKKQRGILMELQQEKHEMRRLKQMQSAASRERKTILNKQYKMIKAQQLENVILNKNKRTPIAEKRRKGPVKVYNLHSQTETIKSETSISRKSSVVEEIVNITSLCQSVVSSLPQEINYAGENLENTSDDFLIKAKQALQLRESNLQKREIELKELFQWHQTSLEKKQNISQLEKADPSVIGNVTASNSQISPSKEEVHKFKGEVLNLLWKIMTGREENKFNIKETYSLNQFALEQFCKEALINRKSNSKNEQFNIPTLSNAISEKSSKSIQTEGSSQKIKSINSGTSLLEHFSSVRTVTSEPEGVKRADKLYENSEVTINNQNKLANGENFHHTYIECDLPKSHENDLLVKINNEVLVSDDNSLSVVSSIKSIDDLQERIHSKSEDKLYDCAKKPTDLSPVLDIKPHYNVRSDNIEDENDSSDSNTLKTRSRYTLNNGLALSEVPSKLSDHDYRLCTSEPLNNKTCDTFNSDKSKAKTLTESDVLSEIDDFIMDKSDELIQGKFDNSIIVNESHERLEQKMKETKVAEKIDPVPYSEVLDLVSNVGDANKLKLFDSIEADINTNKSDYTNTDISKSSNVSEICESIDKRTDETEVPENTSIVQSNLVLDLILDNKERSKSNSEKSIESYSEVYQNLNALPASTESASDYDVSSNDLDKTAKTIKSDNQTDKETDGTLLKEQKTLPSDAETNNGSFEASETEHKSTESVVSLTDDLLENSGSQNVTFTKTDKHLHTELEVTSVINEDIRSYKSEHQESLNGDGDALNVESSSKEYKITDYDESSRYEEQFSHSVSEVLTENSNSIHSLRDEPDKNGKDQKHLDVKKRVSEILSEVQITPREDKLSRVQDLYITAYDVTSSENSPENGSPLAAEDKTIIYPNFDEAEELYKKQLAIEQEIKQLQLQQKEQLPLLYMREIPNKPPPPYTPPVAQKVQIPSILPDTPDKVDLVVENVIGILYNAYCNGTIRNVTISDDTVTFLISGTRIEKQCFQFLLNLCIEAAIEHYDQFEKESGPIWMALHKKKHITSQRTVDKLSLERFIKSKVKQCCNFEKVHKKESKVIKWSRKKRDHVEELLVLESQNEQGEWTNCDYDELLIMNSLTNDIFNMIVSEAGSIASAAFKKKGFIC